MLRKIGDVKNPCHHPEHNPPTMIVLSPGVYEHTCPACGDTVTFAVNGGGPWLMADAQPPSWSSDGAG